MCRIICHNCDYKFPPNFRLNPSEATCCDKPDLYEHVDDCSFNLTPEESKIMWEALQASKRQDQKRLCEG